MIHLKFQNHPQAFTQTRIHTWELSVANLAFFLSFGYELKPIPSLQLETIWSEGQAKGTTKSRRRSSKQLAFLHALERAMRNKQERKEGDKDARGRELINWLKDTHILFSMTLSGGDVTWW